MSTPPNHDDLMTPAQLVRKYPFMTRSTLYGVFKAGLLPFYAVPSRRGSRGKYLVKESEFLAWLETNRHEAGDGPDEQLVHIR